MHPLQVGMQFLNIMTKKVYRIKALHLEENKIHLEAVESPLVEAVVSKERLQEWFDLKN